jgi:hypothetical protein
MTNYKIVYVAYTWTVVDVATNEGIVCFPTQIAAVNWIEKQSNKKISYDTNSSRITNRTNYKHI